MKMADEHSTSPMCTTREWGLDFVMLRHRGGSTVGQGGTAPNEKCGPPVAPHFGPAFLDFHLNRPVISVIQLQNTPVIPLIQLHIVAPAP